MRYMDPRGSQPLGLYILIDIDIIISVFKKNSHTKYQ